LTVTQKAEVAEADEVDELDGPGVSVCGRGDTTIVFAALDKDETGCASAVIGVQASKRHAPSPATAGATLRVNPKPNFIFISFLTFELEYFLFSSEKAGRLSSMATIATASKQSIGMF
jgi:hypothetical protein